VYSILGLISGEVRANIAVDSSVDHWSLGLRSNRRIYSIRTYIHKFEVRSNFFSKVRRIFDEPT
jgi:hypothetical protein